MAKVFAMTIVPLLLHERRHSDWTYASSNHFEALYRHNGQITAGRTSNLMLLLHKDRPATHEGR